MRFPTILLACALAACSGAKDGDPKPSVRSVQGLPLALADSSITTGSAAYARNLAAGDTLVYRYFRNDSLVLAKRRVQLADTVQLGAPAYGQTAAYVGTLQVERGGRASGFKYPAVPVAWAGGPLVYTRAAVPAIDSVVRIVLRALVPLSGDSLRAVAVGAAPTDASRGLWCAFGVTRSGRRVKMLNSWNKPRCEVLYQAFLAERSA